MALEKFTQALLCSLCLLLLGCNQKQDISPRCTALKTSAETEAGEPVIFLPGIKGSYRPRMSGKRRMKLSLVSGPDGLKLIDEYGYMEWTPPNTTPAGRYQVALAELDSEQENIISLQLTVLPSQIVKGKIKDRYFYSHSYVEFNLYIPEKKVHSTWWTTFYSTRTDAHYWSNYSLATGGPEFYSTWNNVISRTDEVELMGKKYVQFKRMHATTLKVIGLSVADKDN